MGFRYTVTAHPHVKKIGKYVFNRKLRRNQFKVIGHEITGYSSVYRKYLDDILLWEVYVKVRHKTAEEAKEFARKRLRRILTRGYQITEAQQKEIVQVFYTYIDKDTGQVVRKKVPH